MIYAICILPDAAVNTDTVELLLGFTNQTIDVATQTPVEFYFHLDFDLHGGGYSESEDVVDGLGNFIKKIECEVSLNSFFILTFSYFPHPQVLLWRLDCN